MRVLVTGGAGFIGSHAVEHFVAAGDEVTVVDKLTYAGSLYNLQNVAGRYDFKALDICSPRDMATTFLHGGFDVVVNFAAETHVDNSINNADPFVDTNVKGAMNLMELAHHYKALFVQISTDEVYGDASVTGKPFYSFDPLRPRNPYSATKAAADLMLLARSNTFNQDYLIFRPSNNFGPRQHREKFLPKLIDSMLSGVEFPLYGDGQQVREWTYAPDTVRLVRETIVSGVRNQVFNISSGYHSTNLDMIQLTKRTLEARGHQPEDVVKFVKDRPGHDRRYWIESSFKPERFTGICDALVETVDSYVTAKR